MVAGIDDNEGVDHDVYPTIVQKCEKPTIFSEGMGNHWQRLDTKARDGISRLSKEEPFVHELLGRHMTELPRMAPMTDPDVLIYLITRFLDGTKNQATVKDAAIYLARSSWNLRLARDRWTDPENNIAIEKEELSDDEEIDEAEDTYSVDNDQSEKSDREIQHPQNSDDRQSRQQAIKEDRARQQEEMSDLNPDIDREAAVKGIVQPDKFTIVFKQPGQEADKRCQFRHRNNGNDFDWHDPEHIRSLNRWRSQLLRRTLGVSKNRKVPRQNFHQEEIDWLVDQHLQYKQQMLEQGRELKWHLMRWKDIAKDFNKRFLGQFLSGCPDPRPLRTKHSLITQKYRVKAIADLTGSPLKFPFSKTGRLQARAKAAGKIKTRPQSAADGSEGSQVGSDEGVEVDEDEAFLAQKEL